MEPLTKLKILIVTKVLLYTILGLWSLFANGLPPLETTSLIAIFPQIFPILVAAISLFLLPLIKQAFYFYVLMAFDILVFVNVFQPLWGGSQAAVFLFLILGTTAFVSIIVGWSLFRYK